MNHNRGELGFTVSGGARSRICTKRSILCVLNVNAKDEGQLRYMSPITLSHMKVIMNYFGMRAIGKVDAIHAMKQNTKAIDLEDEFI